MPDMLARLYDLPDGAPYAERVAAAGITVRRVEPWDRPALCDFVRRNFNETWAVEADRMFIHTPITGYVGARREEIVGFAAYECTRKGFFGPTGVRGDVRGSGLGAALLFACLHSMLELGYAYAVIGGVGPAAFYEKTVNAFTIPGSEIGVYASLGTFVSGDAR